MIRKKDILLSSGEKKVVFFFHVNINFKTPGVFMGVFSISKHGDKSPSSVGAN